jgi:hypothetical protein
MTAHWLVPHQLGEATDNQPEHDPAEHAEHRHLSCVPTGPCDHAGISRLTHHRTRASRGSSAGLTGPLACGLGVAHPQALTPLLARHGPTLTPEQHLPRGHPAPQPHAEVMRLLQPTRWGGPYKDGLRGPVSIMDHTSVSLEAPSHMLSSPRG